jgi:hypothetical protein
MIRLNVSLSVFDWSGAPIEAQPSKTLHGHAQTYLQPMM